jgi:acyl phosphate:glycerol-3-phosphate acyltransferase
MSPDFLLMLVIAYISGALPWSVWLSQRVSGIDPRTVADGNPGAANAFRTAGWRVGVIVLVLDSLKAFIPVLVARYLLNFVDGQLFWIALAPMLGHAFSLFLRLRGGRGLTSMFGVWAGLTLHEVPLVLGITAIIATRLIKNDELKTLLIPVVAGIYLLLRDKPDWMLWLILAQLLIMLAKIIPFYLQKAHEAQA